MVFIGWVYIIIGVSAFLACTAIALTRNDGTVRFPKWIRIGYTFMTGIIALSLPPMFFGEAMIGIRIAASILMLTILLIALYLCTYKIDFTGDGFFYRTIFKHRRYSYADITALYAEIDRGITVLIITLGRQKIVIKKIMSGFEAFLNRLESEKVFIKLTII